MKVKAEINNIHISPRKTRLVIDLVRGLDLTEALQRLSLVNKRAVRPVEKLLKSALANAENNFELQKSNLYIKEIMVGAGPTLYRWMPKAHGSATPLRRRTSLIKVVLGERVETPEKKINKSKKIETVKMDEKLPSNKEFSIDVTRDDRTASAFADSADKQGDKTTRADGKKHVGRLDQAQQTGRPVKKEKGLFKKMFRRKSGM